MDNFFQRGYRNRTALEISWLAELKYSISAGQDIILKNYGVWKFWHESLEKILIDKRKAWSYGGMDSFILMQLHKL